MNYIMMTITATLSEREIIISELSELGSTGFEETDAQLIAYFLEEGFKNGEIAQLMKDIPFQLQTIPSQNWNAEWESSFQPVVVDDFCAVRAEFHDPIKTVKHEIIITPKMSFGTGHHATTLMMMQQMRDMNFTDKTVFDFGTGTGILAILAKKLGASSVTAIDVDEWSFLNAVENLDRNNVSDINLFQSDILPTAVYDIVLANINKNVLLDHSAELRKTLSKNGKLLLSGLLTEDEDEICRAFADGGIRMVKRIETKGWISLLFTN